MEDCHRKDDCQRTIINFTLEVVYVTFLLSDKEKIILPGFEHFQADDRQGGEEKDG